LEEIAEVKVGVAVFLRYPELGRVKTRLAVTLGQERALAVYERLLAHTLAITDALSDDFAVTLFGEPTTPIERYQERFRGPRRRIVLQQGASLGDRLLDACRSVLATTDAVLCVGTDCPEVAPRHFAAAAEALQGHDAVLGPAADGGYWLLGTKRAEPRLFEDVPWSTERVAALTEARFRELRWTWARLETLSDVDEAADVARFGL
jgi:rSAM/selenodomain-associated transferase 1